MTEVTEKRGTGELVEPDQPRLNIYEALAAVMADVSHVAKRDVNQHQHFTFRGVDAVVNAVGPALRKHKVIVTPDVLKVAYENVLTTNNKPATACRVKVAYTFHASDGSSLRVTVAGEAWDHGDKTTAKAMSVAFRIALLQALALPTDEPDPDTQVYEAAVKDWKMVVDTAFGLTDVTALQALWRDEGVAKAPKPIQDQIKAHGEALKQKQADLDQIAEQENAAAEQAAAAEPADLVETKEVALDA